MLSQDDITVTPFKLINSNTDQTNNNNNNNNNKLTQPPRTTLTYPPYDPTTGKSMVFNRKTTNRSPSPSPRPIYSSTSPSSINISISPRAPSPTPSPSIDKSIDINNSYKSNQRSSSTGRVTTRSIIESIPSYRRSPTPTNTYTTTNIPTSNYNTSISNSIPTSSTTTYISDRRNTTTPIPVHYISTTTTSSSLRSSTTIPIAERHSSNYSNSNSSGAVRYSTQRESNLVSHPVVPSSSIPRSFLTDSSYKNLYSKDINRRY